MFEAACIYLLFITFSSTMAFIAPNILAVGSEPLKTMCCYKSAVTQ